MKPSKFVTPEGIKRTKEVPFVHKLLCVVYSTCPFLGPCNALGTTYRSRNVPKLSKRIPYPTTSSVAAAPSASFPIHDARLRLAALLTLPPSS